MSASSSSSAASIQQHFADLTDPRTRKVTYPLTNVVTMSLCAVLGGADDFVAIADWAEDKKEWLAQFLDMSTGVPSHDRFNAILGALKPAEFEKCLLSWITALLEVTDGQPCRSCEARLIVANRIRKLVCCEANMARGKRSVKISVPSVIMAVLEIWPPFEALPSDSS